MKAKRYHHLLVACFGLLLLPLSISGVEPEEQSGNAGKDTAASAGEVEFFQLSKEISPVLIKRVAPEYPAEARGQKLSGRVFVRFRIGTDGKVDSAQVLKGDPVFHDAAIKAVRQFEFSPVMQNENPVAVWMTQAVRFKIQNGGSGSSKPEESKGQPAIMDLWVNSEDELLLDRDQVVTLDEAVMELRERLKKSGLRKAILRSLADHPGVAENFRRSSIHSVSIRAEQNVNGRFLQDLIQKLRQEKVELRITIL